MDIADGPIYLALVKYDDKTKEWSNSPVVDDNNYSSYSKLVNAIDLARQATGLYNEYMNAKNAVDKAQKRTQELVDQIAKIKISDLAEKSAKIEELKEALKKANE